MLFCLDGLVSKGQEGNSWVMRIATGFSGNSLLTGDFLGEADIDLSHKLDTFGLWAKFKEDFIPVLD